MQKNNPGSAGGALARESISVDICIIGAGPGGLAVAGAAAAFGQRVVVIEKHKMGGSSLNYGSVPSKALLAAARRAHQVSTADSFGISGAGATVDHAAVWSHVRGAIDAIAPNASVERLNGFGVHVVTAAGRFVDRDTVEAGEFRIKARRFVIATGSSPLIPEIPGLNDVPYFTNETVFDNARPIAHLIIVGAGPDALELAQAYRRLGSDVTVIEQGKALANEDRELASIVLERLRDEGITILEDAPIARISGSAQSIAVSLKSGETESLVEGSHLLIAAGRKPNIADLALDTARVKFTKAGVAVGPKLRTSNRRIYAIGDVTGGPPYAHMAEEHAAIVLRRILFRLPAKVNTRAIPRVMFTDPELAHVGLLESEARAQYGKVNVLRWPFSENDRAQAEGETTGHVKAVISPKGDILGATVVGPQAGEIIQSWTLAISQRINIKAMPGWISPYPTLSEVNKRAAFRYYAAAPGNPILRKVISLLAKLG